MGGPLEGVRVIDLTQVVAGPFGTMLLADQGADVIKVEPLEGELVRLFPSFARNGVSSFIANNNRGKRSIAVDLGSDAGVDVVRRLAATADVFIQNFRPGVVERMGLDPTELRRANPRLVTCSMSGFGADGPWADDPVYDPVIQAMTGHVDVQLNPDIPFPDLVRTIVVDKSTALTAAQAVTAALFQRERTGTGQHVELSMLDAAISFFWPDGMLADTLLGDDVTGGRALYEIYRLTQCADGHIVYFAATQPEFDGLVRALGRPELADDPRFSTVAARVQPENLEAAGQIIAEAFESLSVAEATKRLRAEGVPVGPVLARHEVVEHEQVRHNGKIFEWEHPVAGRMRHAGPAADFSESPVEACRSVPLLGQHTDEVLAGAGFGVDEIDSLRAAGVLARSAG